MDALAILNLFGNILCVLVIIGIVVQFIGYALIRYLKRYRWAAWYYSALLVVLPWSEAMYINRAWVRLCLKEFDKAIADCDQAIYINPEAAMAYNNRSAAFLGLTRYPEALRDAHQAVHLKSDLASAYYNRAYALFGLRNYAAALKDYDQAIARHPQLAVQYFNRGICHMRLKHYSEAIADYNKTIELKPTTSSAYHNRGHAHMILGNYTQGLADFQKSCALEPQELIHPLALQWCQLCLQPQLTDEIRARFTSLAALVDRNGLHHMYQGMDLWFNGAYMDALNQFELDITFSRPFSGDSYFWCGMALAALGRYDEAQGAIDHALQRGLSRFFLKTLALLPSEHTTFAARYLS
ncbi:hypothetical protein KDW_64040 [Dictyobacter vulcani]|uniref:Uncharacterized protein n=1 Tax=Dictyobacter vulcani TaxID=2607529 RepID=A0A5J4KYU1_9CHLR|nr:tetratricopeptide repeat protein [Dictyobacter vulcani]GER92242.1 hypothetical protein KDW_64040 [Dictyobacter vulcani]